MIYDSKNEIKCEICEKVFNNNKDGKFTKHLIAEIVITKILYAIEVVNNYKTISSQATKETK
jgi:hypothetical protein